MSILDIHTVVMAKYLLITAVHYFLW